MGLLTDTQVGIPGGLATLDEDGLLETGQRPNADLDLSFLLARAALQDMVRDRGGQIGGGSTGTRVALPDSWTTSANAASGRAQFPLEPARYAIAGKTTMLQIVVALAVNDTAPGNTMTFGLYPISTVSGAAAQVVLGLGAVVAGSTVAIVTPAANAKPIVESAKFAMPALGLYALGVVHSAGTAANSEMTGRMMLLRDYA